MNQNAIKNIWAVGRTYGEHAKELGNAVPTSQQDPMIFLKAGSCVVANGETFELPGFSKDIHHECEVAFLFNEKLEFEELTLALDLTARDVQDRLKKAGHPWTLAKSFKNSCPLGIWAKIPKGQDLQNLKFTFKVNGEMRQSGTTSDMIHSVEALRRYVIDRFPVVPGDVLLTGTPQGVGLLRSGEKLLAQIEGLVEASWQIA